MTSPNEPVWADNPPYSGSAADLSGTSTTDVAKQQASQVAQSASGAVQQVTGTAKDQAAVVASDAKEHARNLVGETRDQVSQQAATQRDKAVTNLRSMGDQLHTMAQSGDSSGVAGTLARQAGDTTHNFAGYLEGREPSDLVDDLTSLARRRPGAFLLGAAVAGIAAGRLTKGLTASSSDGSSYPRPTPPPQAAIDMPVTSGTGYSDGLEPLTGQEYEAHGTSSYGTTPYATEWSDPAGSTLSEPGTGPVIP